MGRRKPEAQKAEARKAAARVAARKRAQREIALLAVGVVVVIAIGVAVAHAFTSGAATSGAARPTATPLSTPESASVTTRPIDGIPCNQSEQLTYHVHAHLTILDRGRQVPVPQYIGINLLRSCYYWLHTHDAFGVIHIEAPHKVSPTLGQFFDIWQQPLSRTQVASAPVASRESMRVYINTSLYRGDPRAIRLTPHESITIEVGPPFPASKRYKFPAGY